MTDFDSCKLIRETYGIERPEGGSLDMTFGRRSKGTFDKYLTRLQTKTKDNMTINIYFRQEKPKNLPIYSIENEKVVHLK